jgi:class 3 adenylate cyclase
VLPELTEPDLTTTGLPVGPRRKLLKAIAALRLGALRSPAAEQPSVPAPAAAPPPEAECRQLALMFCDLVGPTPLSARLAPEDLRAVIATCHRFVAEAVRRFDGFVAKYMGDGVLAYFGYPRADEDDAERAVRAGLALVDAATAPGRPPARACPVLDTGAGFSGIDNAAGAPLQVRAGIATGLVVVGDLIGQAAAQEQAVVGETPNLNARPPAPAKPGTVVIGPSTRRLTGGLFGHADLGAVEIKGFAAPKSS